MTIILLTLTPSQNEEFAADIAKTRKKHFGGSFSVFKC